ncbi:MAG: hypothetical protein CMN31_26770 [Sandaracinus sp.]|nr:hypothetical protein [Sandaracinus sp.]MBJ74892.1 hypothetical protein [Sandaracinus sp.]
MEVVRPHAGRALAALEEAVMRALILALATCAALLAASGCPRGPTEPTLPVVTTDDPEAEAALREAREASEAGDLETADTRYRAFLERYPGDPLVPVAKLGLGRVLLAAGDPGAARGLFAEVATHEDARLAERGRFYEGVALQLLGESEAAIERLRPLVGRTVDPEETALLLRTLGAAAEQLERRAEAVEVYDRLAAASVDAAARDEARARLDALIAELERDELDALLESLPRDGVAWPAVGRRALRAAFEAGELGRVRTIAEALSEARVPLERELQSMALRAQRTGRTDLGAIGAILPLSGRGREVGQNALQGLMLGAGLPLDGPPDGDTPRVFFRDGAGDPERAAQAVDDLVTLHQVVAILGPIDGRSARAAARRAEELGVPLLTLTPDPRIVDEGPMVFRLFPAPSDEARELVAEARRRGVTRIAALVPEHGYGATMREAFRVATEEAGLEWAGAAGYAADATSFREPLEELKRLRFDGLVLPDHARKLVLLAPALAAADLWSHDGEAPVPDGARPVRLLIPSVGLDGQLVRSAGRYLQGALFSQPFHGPSATGPGRRFADAFRDRYERPADVFAAAAFDGFRLVRGVVDAGAQSRAEVAERLQQSAGAETASAVRGFRPDRQPYRGTRVLELRGPMLSPTLGDAD